jgi:DMSO/TMAO reductase YedYZ molybdopterin-dependent catalytic subunit
MPLEALRYPLTPAGLHYVLVHYDIPAVDTTAYRLAIDGRVGSALSLSLDDLRARPAVTRAVTIECAGNGRARLSPRPVSQPWLVEAVGNGAWTGVPLRPLLEEAGVEADAVEILFTGLDSGVEGGVEQAYQRSLPLGSALSDDVLLAYELNGEPLPPQHGYPLRLVVPGWYGMAHVKWLAAITAIEQPFDGFQQATAYRMRQSPEDEGDPVTRIMPRSLMAPPGIPDFMSRERFLQPGPTRLEGRAWSGWGSITRVEVSADGGLTWHDADLAPETEPTAWRGWSFPWNPPEEARYELCSRATDSAGNTQPLDVPWNLHGYANNAVQRVPVTVRA